MATMVKEKRREKKRVKEKPTSSRLPQSEPSAIVESDEIVTANTISDIAGIAVCTNVAEDSVADSREREAEEHAPEANDTPAVRQIIHKETTELEQNKDQIKEDIEKLNIKSINSPQVKIPEKVPCISEETSFKDISIRLERMSIPAVDRTVNLEQLEHSLEHPQAYLNAERQSLSEECVEAPQEVVAPSAPALEEEMPTTHSLQQPEVTVEQEVSTFETPKEECMSLEDAIKLFAGEEMEIVRVLSEREEAIVEAGPVSGPQHPLVDLLSTFSSSLKALTRERVSLCAGFAAEAAGRAAVWRVEARTLRESRACPCGAAVAIHVRYERAKLLVDRLPAAKMRLELLLKDLQESYCHHQHAALRAFYQIEELISETISGGKAGMREALALVLGALRGEGGGGGGAPAVLPAALQRWATALAAALLDGRDVSHTLHLMHHLFRQSRSVSWGARVLRGRVRAGAGGGGGAGGAARALALLHTLLTYTPAQQARECTEECSSGEEAWEEVCARGGGGGVREGALRERDLRAAVRALPLRAIVATILLFEHADVTTARASTWGDVSGGRGVVRACCGVRALLHALGAGARTHTSYRRLHADLATLALHALRGLAALHLHSREQYSPSMVGRVTAELEACWGAGWAVLGATGGGGGGALHRLPATLLPAHTARRYCAELAADLHDASWAGVRAVRVPACALSCGARVRMVTRAAVHQRDHRELAVQVMDFLFQTGVRRGAGAGAGAGVGTGASTCAGGCVAEARRGLPLLLRAHPPLHTRALLMLADTHQVEPVSESAVGAVWARGWRGAGGEARAVLDRWAACCPHLLPALLAQLDYTPHTGLSLSTQLEIGWWLCSHVGARPPEWAWGVLRALRVHCTWWGVAPDAPPPPPPPAPEHVFHTAYALLASDWGCCIPVICSCGVSALGVVAGARPVEAAHCAARVLLAMAPSPQSVALTPRFSEALNVILSSGPSLVQRALRGAGAAVGGAVGGVGGAGAECAGDVLRALVLQQVKEHNPAAPPGAVVSVWLHALCSRPLTPAGGALLDALLLAAAPHHHACHQFLAHHLQEGTAGAVVSAAVRVAGSAPLLAAGVLRAAAAGEGALLAPRLADLLHEQRAARTRIHVDNALKSMGAGVCADELAIHLTASACLSAPPQRAPTLLLWELLLQLYLQRPPAHMSPSTPAVGPLFFSGLLKSRVLPQLQRRLLECAAHHRSRAHQLAPPTRTGTDRAPPPTPPTINNSGNAKEPDIDGMFPMLSISDLTGEASGESSGESSESDSDSEASEPAAGGGGGAQGAAGAARGAADDELRYHVAAEKMLSELSKWLGEGEGCRAMPHHAALAAFMPTQLLEAAFSRELELLYPAPPPPPAPTAPPPAPTSPFQQALDSVLAIKDRSVKRSRRVRLVTALEGAAGAGAGAGAGGDAGALVRAVDEHLAHLQALANEWSADVGRVCALDVALWDLVRALRVPRALTVRRRCDKGCPPTDIHLQEDEWCISTSAQRGIEENRRSARAVVVRLARPRPLAARSAAALLALARRVGSAATAIRVAERAWRAARGAGVGACAPAHSALTALVDVLAERWLCGEGGACVELISSWARGGRGGRGARGEWGAVQAALCGALVRPRALRPDRALALYRLLLAADLPPHLAFSFLSKFEMSRWSETLEAGARRSLLEALVGAAERWGARGAKDDEDCHVLLELLGVHLAALVGAGEVCWLGALCTRAAVGGRLPPALWAHVARGAQRHAHTLPPEQLSDLLVSMGRAWWEARAGGGARGGDDERLAAHAHHLPALLVALSRAHVAASRALTYTPERVAALVWPALSAAWAPWVLPPLPTAPPLTPAPAQTQLARQFAENILQLMADCPGIEESMLSLVFEWAVQTSLACGGGAGGGAGGAVGGAWLEELRALPWTERQWVTADTIPTALKVCECGDRALQSWCGAAWSGAEAGAWVRGAGGGAGLGRVLADLLLLLTAMPQQLQTLSMGTQLPWGALGAEALQPALDRFFAAHHEPHTPYHNLPQFRVLLFASELRAHPAGGGGGAVGGGSGGGVGARDKRCAMVSRWVCAACSPALAPHVPAHAAAVLEAITNIAADPGVCGTDEPEELLSRAAAILCIEPAAAAALTVWTGWVRDASARLVGAAVWAAGALTAFEPFAALADSAVRAHCLHRELGGWREIGARLSACPWREAGPLCARARLHAGYALTHAHAHAPAHVHAALLALLAADIDFVEDEVIVAVWLCAACRWAAGGEAGAAGGEAGAAGRAWAGRCARDGGRSLLQIVTMQAAGAAPTPRHRLLARLALCILSPSEENTQQYLAACGGALPPAHSDARAWGAAPHPAHLPRLAVRLFPREETYFREELQLAERGG